MAKEGRWRRERANVRARARDEEKYLSPRRSGGSGVAFAHVLTRGGGGAVLLRGGQ